MTTIFVCFADSTEAVITGYAVCPQPEDSWPNQGAVETSDARWKTYYDARNPNGSTPLSQLELPIPE
jgi:hypothetical protein